MVLPVKSLGLITSKRELFCFLKVGHLPPANQWLLLFNMLIQPLFSRQLSASSTSVTVPAPTLPLHPAIPPQFFAEPAQAKDLHAASGLTFSLKTSTPVFKSTSKKHSNITTTNSSSSASNREPPKKYPRLPVFPKGVPPSQAISSCHSHLSESPAILQPASQSAAATQIPFYHPHSGAGPHFLPSR